MLVGSVGVCSAHAAVQGDADPVGVALSLESLATSFMQDPPAARVIGTLDQLPPRHRARIGGDADQQYLWFAWEEDARTRLITGAPSLEHSRERDRPVLEARVYDKNGQWVHRVVLIVLANALRLPSRGMARQPRIGNRPNGLAGVAASLRRCCIARTRTANTRASSSSGCWPTTSSPAA